MHTVELLEGALRQVQALGYGVRQEWLGGSGGGACSMQGRKWLFLDLAQSPEEHLALARQVLAKERAAPPAEPAPQRKSA